MIDILVPVLCRPDNAWPLVDSILGASSVEVEVYFICSPGDEPQISACLATGQRVGIVDWEPGHADYGLKMNWAYARCGRDFLLLAADDLTFDDGWDDWALACADSYGVIGTNDMASATVMSGRSSTHPLVRRSYIEEYGGSYDGPGTLIHEGYDHNFSERELVELAKRRGQWVFCRESVVRHRHPLWKTTEWDDTYRKAMANYQQDAQLFASRRRRYTRQR